MKTRKRTSSKKIVAALLFALIFGGIGLYKLLLTNALSQNTIKSSFDYGQIAGNGWSQPAGGVFDGTTYSAFNFHNTTPQQMVYQLGYDSTRLEVLSVTCRTSWGCYKSQVNQDYFGLEKPSVYVCIDVPNGNFPNELPMFTIRFKTRVALSQASNWWTSSSGVAPNTCQKNITAEGFMFNTIDGSGVCDGQFEPCDRGPSPAIGNYIGFGPPKGTVGKTTGTKGTNSGRSGGGGSSSATAQSNRTNSVPTASSQGNNEQPSINPSPFYDGKEYATGSDPIDKTLGNLAVSGHKIVHGWLYLAAVATAVVGGAAYYLWRKRKGFALLKR